MMAEEQQEQSNLTAEATGAVENENEIQKVQDLETSSARLPLAKPPGRTSPTQGENAATSFRSFTASAPVVENGAVWWSAGVSADIINYGCSCSMSTFRPKVIPGNYSRMTTFVANDDASHPEQSIQAGWIRAVDSISWPSGVDPDLCQVFVYFSTTGSTGDYADNVQGWNDEVSGWVQVDGAFRPGHDVIPASHINGPQGFLDLKFQLEGDRWNLRMNSTVLGYFPTSLFTVNTQDTVRPPLPDQTKTLADHANRVGFFGQVYDGTSDGMAATHMGSGKYPDEGFGKSAFISKMQYQHSPTGQDATMTDADNSWYQHSDDPMRYECRVSWKSNSMWRSYMYLGGPGCEATGWSSWESAGGIFEPGIPVISVSRKSTVIDLFIVGNDGKVYTSWWYDEDWSGLNSDWRLLDWGGNEKFLIGSRIAAVARSPDNLDIFVVGEDSKIYTAWWSDGHDWTGWRNISGDSTFPLPFIAAVSRMDGQLDVFVATAGSVYFTHWTDSVTDWTGIDQPWDSVGAVGGLTQFNLLVVSRTPDTMEVFTSGAGSDGKPTIMWNTWSEGSGTTNGTWQNFLSIGHPPSMLLGSRVAAVARNSDRVDVFAIGDDFSVYTSYWNTFDVWSGIEDEWKKVGSAIPGVTFAYSDIIAVSRKPACIDVFVSALDGQIYATSLDESALPNQTWTDWQSLGGNGFSNPSKPELTFTAVSRNHQTLAVIGCGLNSKLWVAEWLDPVCGPRPFYCMAHNPNVFNATTDDPAVALQTGANSLGPDVNRSKDSGKLVISHGGTLGKDPGSDSDPDLADYLKHLRDLAGSHPQFVLVAFDCKEATYLSSTGEVNEDLGANFGVELLNAIRTNLTNFVPLDIVISVAKRNGVSMFKDIHGMLTSREAIAIDQEDDPEWVARYFQQQLRATSKAVYGYGNTVQIPLPVFDPNIRYSIEWGVGLRTGYGLLQSVYEWTSDDLERIREYIRIGADGIMSNFEFLFPQSIPDPPALKALVELVKTDREMRRLVRMATRNDRILTPSKPGYLLIVFTGSTGAAGTDARITLVVRGELGIIKKTVDTSLQGRMESGKKDFVVIQSRDIGNLIDITVYNDMGASFLGNSAWRCEKVSVVSKRYGVDTTAVFGVDIHSTPVARTFV